MKRKKKGEENYKIRILCFMTYNRIHDRGRKEITKNIQYNICQRAEWGKYVIVHCPKKKWTISTPEEKCDYEMKAWKYFTAIIYTWEWFFTILCKVRSDFKRAVSEDFLPFFMSWIKAIWAPIWRVREFRIHVMICQKYMNIFQKSKMG